MSDQIFERLKKNPVFLTAEWKKLAMANYAIDPQILQPLVPRFTELDFYEGKTYVSLVGFMFLNTRLKGIPIPFHQHSCDENQFENPGEVRRNEQHQNR